MEAGFINAPGDLACRLMAALQGANTVGADTRCTANGTSSLFAFVKVAQPGDSYGNPSFIVSIRTHANAQIEPVDTLQTLFNIQHMCVSTGLKETNIGSYINIYPNPSTGKIIIEKNAGGKILPDAEINIYNLSGEKIYSTKLIRIKTALDLTKQDKGIYLFQLANDNGILQNGKIIIE
jgi:hypothetical protein